MEQSSSTRKKRTNSRLLRDLTPLLSLIVVEIDNRYQYQQRRLRDSTPSSSLIVVEIDGHRHSLTSKPSK
jgi:hypothetical protein